ncbi:MAG: hypothetical protein WEC73_04920 [Chthoniobacterales bacterium]
MKRMLLASILAACTPVAGQASLSARQMAAADRTVSVTVPTPAEFFGAIDKISRPDWASFYRDPGPTSFPTRPQTAFNLGVLVTDGYIAVEAQDGQQVKNTGKEIIALARALGVGEDVLARGKSIADFADQNDWFALREELEATTNEVRRAMAGQRDEGLASLITAGAWLRALQVGSRVGEAGGDESCVALLRQPGLVSFLREQIDSLPEKARRGPVVTRVGAALEIVEQAMTADPAAGQVEVIRVETSDLIGQLGSKP